MAWIIMKCWKAAPQARQRATLKVYATWREAKGQQLKLDRLFPGCIFTVEELDNSSEGFDR